ncbi:hypothetical protein KR074_007996 [Drosophila pseudoananassae]|nr:hypothetical protein KR074_007996 [Drosophila pseudoananassae]
MADQKTVDLLWNCAKSLTSETHAERLLKSHYINTCRKLARHNVQLPEDSFGPARMCSRCGNQWSDGRYELHLESQKLRQNAKNRRLIARLDAVKAKMQRGEMSSAARKRAKWLKKRMASHMAVDCEVCRHKTMLPLEKGRKRAKLQDKEESIVVAQPAATGPTKKKAKTKAQNKDINAGLKIPQTEPKQQQPTPAKKAPQTVQHPSQTPKKKNQKKNKATQPAPAPKTQSKTQKQNALLQLAAQLKSNAFKNASKSQENRLQAFLK